MAEGFVPLCASVFLPISLPRYCWVCFIGYICQGRELHPRFRPSRFHSRFQPSPKGIFDSQINAGLTQFSALSAEPNLLSHTWSLSAEPFIHQPDLSAESSSCHKPDHFSLMILRWPLISLWLWALTAICSSWASVQISVSGANYRSIREGYRLPLPFIATKLWVWGLQWALESF
jgi:hypothetical protein